MALVTIPEIQALDPYFDNVVLLLTGNGANGSTVFSDNSFFKRPVTAQNGAQISTDESKFGGSSGAFFGAGKKVVVASNAGFDLPGDLTIETWVYRTIATTGVIATRRATNAVGVGSFRLSTDGFEQLQTPAVLLSWPQPAMNQWVHLAVSRSGSLLSGFVSGVLISQTTSTFNFTCGYDLFIGCDNDNSALSANAYINDFRITKGVGRYTENFTPPAVEFPWLELNQLGVRSLTDPIARRICAPPRALVSGGPVTTAFDNKLAQRNIYQGGTGQITGTVKEKSLPANVPLHRRVCLLEEKTRLLVAETWSDAVTGNYTFDRIDMERTYTVMAYDHTGLYRAVIADRLVPDQL